MKKRTELKIWMALLCAAGLLTLQSGLEAEGQQRYQDALYQNNSTVTMAEKKLLEEKTDSLIAKTKRLEIFHIDTVAVQFPSDVTIRVYNDPRDFLYENTPLTWYEVDRLFWAGPYAYYGPYGIFGPYSRAGWGWPCWGWRGYRPYYSYYNSWYWSWYYSGIFDPWFFYDYALAFYDPWFYGGGTWFYENKRFLWGPNQEIAG